LWPSILAAEISETITQAQVDGSEDHPVRKLATNLREIAETDIYRVGQIK